LGARGAPLRVLGGFGFFWGICGDLGARDAPLRVFWFFLGVFGFLGGVGAPDRCRFMTKR
jgi:hypothetical protein